MGGWRARLSPKAVVLTVLLVGAVLADPLGGAARAAGGQRVPVAQRDVGRDPAAATGPVQLTGDAAWCWFADPRAVTVTGQRTRTFIGWIDRSGRIDVASYDHASYMFTTAVLQTGIKVDDHSNPAILVLPDRRLAVFWSGHNGSQMQYRVGALPESVLRWGPVRTVGTNVPGPLGYTYPNPFRLAAEGGRTWLFWRGGNIKPAFSTTTDLVHWTPARSLLAGPSFKRPYLKVHANGVDSFDVAFTDAHPDPRESGGNTSVFYARYRAGAFHKADGTRIATLAQLPFTPAQADKVYDGVARGAPSWVHDVAVDPDGHPVIVYAAFPTTADHRYRYARWNGTGWDDHEITDAGGSIASQSNEPFYSGGVSLDHEDPSVVYLSKKVGAVWEIQRWTTPDGGAGWSAESVTSGSAQSNFRPVSPRQLRGGDLQVVWMHGSYPGFTTFQTSLTSLLSHAFTTLRVSAAPATISYGQSVRVGGRLLRSDTRALLAGRQVEVYGRRKGTTAWALLARRTTDGAGAITYDRRVGGTAEFQVRYRGSAAWARASSPIITVTVR
ncbi:MAG TPA: BNR-4 repeat-containing protein [Actinomycetes bacterium]|nr:BNR-4 repeat-containing protein [Actinomycetes bacterium]